MKVERSPDDRGGDALEGQVRALLSVDPSPEFVARVRRRLAQDGTGGISKGWPAFAGIAVLAATIVLLAVVLRQNDLTVSPAWDRTPDLPRESASVSVPRVAPAAPAPSPQAVVAEPRQLRPRRSLAAQPPATVMISASERRALQTFVDGIRLRPTELSPVVVSRPADDAALAIVDLTVAAIEVPPIAVLALHELTQ